jgi:hypothetical protein
MYASPESVKKLYHYHNIQLEDHATRSSTYIIFFNYYTEKVSMMAGKF